MEKLIYLIFIFIFLFGALRWYVKILNLLSSRGGLEVEYWLHIQLKVWFPCHGGSNPVWCINYPQRPRWKFVTCVTELKYRP